MPIEARLLTGLGLALALAYFATPVAIRVADRLQFYDRPVGYKGHATPTPYLGGAAVILAFVAATLALTGDWGRTAPVVGGVLVLWLVGTIDDRRTVLWHVRVAIEIALAVGLWALGLGWELGAGPVVDVLVSILWVLAVVNSFNLFDNMDGAAGAMATVSAAAIAVLGLVDGNLWLAVVAGALCGACAGFLPYNLRSPARIFLGDGGSMPIGFAVAALAMVGASDAAAEWQSLAMGLLLVGVPALDTALVIVSRRRRGVSLLTGGRDHLTHRARTQLATARAVAVTLGGIQAIISALAIMAVRGGSSGLVVAVVLYLLALGVVIALLDTRVAPVEDNAAVAGAAMAGARPPLARIAPLAVVAPLGIALGLSPLDAGFYDTMVWVPAGLLLVAVCAAVAIGWTPRLTRRAWMAIGALAALAGWALLSATWADSVQQAVIEANRLLVYVLLLGALLAVVRRDSAALWLIGAIGAAVAAVAGDVVVRMLGSGAADLFVGGRLDAPLGYINGQASYFLVGAWILIAVAGQRRSAILAGASLGGAALLACLLVLSQSRGVALAAAGSVLLVLAVLPHRLRNASALLVLGGAVAAAAPALFDVFESAASPALATEAHEAARASLLAALVAGTVWGAAVAAVRRPVVREWMRPAVGAGLAILALLGAGVAVAKQETIRSTLDTQYTAFVRLGIEPQGSALSGGSATSRLVSGAGTRYDYWRIAWSTFKDKPLAGVGAGNYDRPYFQRRATVEDVRQPHSIQLQVLSELGLVGAALLLAFLVALAAGIRRLALAARRSEAAAVLGVAAAGMVTAWLVHTSVDWIHLLPGVTGMALAAAAVMLRRAPGEPAPAVNTGPARTRGAMARRLVPAAAVGLILTTGSVSLTREALAERFRANGQEALAADPGRALVDADRALRLDAEDVDAYYLKAAALARFGRGDDADRALREAARREPQAFVTWALLGDLAVRRGRPGEAAEFYRRASVLNPRDAGLAQLATDPTSAR